MCLSTQCWIVITIRDVYPQCKFNVHIPISHHHFAYSLCHFHWAPMKNKRCSLSGPLMLMAKSGEKFVQKFAKFWPFRGPGDQGVWKVAGFTAKVSSLRESTSFEPFCVKIGWGCALQGWAGKSHKDTRGSHRNDVSPLTQCLRYRAACDTDYGPQIVMGVTTLTFQGNVTSSTVTLPWNI